MPKVSFLIPARQSAPVLAETTAAVHDYLQSRYPGDFEIIIIPNPEPNNVTDTSSTVAITLAKTWPDCVRVVPHTLPVGKGAALATGFSASHGDFIFFTDADLPYDLSFFDHADQALQNGYDLIAGNRRDLESRFRIPVKFLRVAHRRLRSGGLFNFVIRTLLPITTRDTQSGIKAMTRRLATLAFERQKAVGFFFDIELFLTAHSHGYRVLSLPVTFNLRDDASTVRVWMDGLRGFWSIFQIRLRLASGHYGIWTTSELRRRDE